MNEEKKKNYALNTKEYNEITKAHNDFDKTMFGKKVKLLTIALSTLSIAFVIMFFICIIANAAGEKNFDIFAGICVALFITNTSLLMVSQILYESMVMNYINYKK